MSSYVNEPCALPRAMSFRFSSSSVAGGGGSATGAPPFLRAIVSVFTSLRHSVIPFFILNASTSQPAHGTPPEAPLKLFPRPQADRRSDPRARDNACALLRVSIALLPAQGARGAPPYRRTGSPNCDRGGSTR